MESVLKISCESSKIAMNRWQQMKENKQIYVDEGMYDRATKLNKSEQIINQVMMIVEAISNICDNAHNTIMDAMDTRNVKFIKQYIKLKKIH